MKNISSLLLIFIVMFGFTQCKNEDKQSADTTKESTSNEASHQESEEGTVQFSTAQLKSVGIELGRIENKQLSSTLKANGVLKVPNQNKATVNSLYSGVVKQILVEPGFVVKKGQVIAKVSNPEFIEVQGQYLNTQSQIQKAEQEVTRQKMLFEGNAGALKNLQAAETELKTLQNMRAMYAQQIKTMGINPSSISSGNMVAELAIKSPITGTVAKIGVEMGSFISSSTMIVEIIDNSQLHLDLFVYEKDLPNLRNNQIINFTLTNNPGRTYEAQIFSMGNTFEDESKAVSIHARVLNDKTGLIDGMAVTANVSLENAMVSAVPDEAIVSDKGNDYIFIVVNNESSHNHDDEHSHNDGHSHDDEPAKDQVTFKKVLIAKGMSDVGYTQITLLSDIPSNATIVTKGAFFVIAKMNDSGGHDHAH